MRTLYLIRHAHPQMPPGPRRCIGRTDLPLDELGREQCAALAVWVQSRQIDAVYASPARRCQETAAALGYPVRLREDLLEMDMGAWENLPFPEIQRRWPEEYAARGEHMGRVAPPGGESFAQAGARLDAVLKELLAVHTGGIAVVTHAGPLRGWLCGILGRDPDRVLELRQPWGGVTTVTEESGRMSVTELGLRPLPPGPLERAALYQRCGTPEPVQAHCAAVAELALRLAGDAPIDRDALRAACLLHDLFRPEGRNHARLGADFLAEQGWPRVAAIVARHHDLDRAATPEAELLYLADKLLAGTRRVSLAERFDGSKRKCVTPEARLAWQRRYHDALRLETKWRNIK